MTVRDSASGVFLQNPTALRDLFKSHFGSLVKSWLAAKASSDWVE
jgi:hypothetical protein